MDKKMQRMQFWQQQHAIWKESGLSQSDFCKSHGFSLSTFCRWRCKALKAERATSNTKITLVPATVVAQSPLPVPEPDNTLALCSPSGWKIIIAPGIGERFLTRLLERLS